MKKETKKIAGEITYAILEIIARTPEALIGAFLDHKSLNSRFVGEREYISDKLLHHLWNLKRSGYIETKTIDGSTSVRLTVKGKIKNLEGPSNRKPDGRLRIISYDIPEKYKIKRHRLCRSLRRIGYKKLQKSLWICKYAKAEEIDLILDELGIQKYVAYFVISKSNIEEHIKNLLDDNK